MMHSYPNPHPQRPMQPVQQYQPVQQFNPQQQQMQQMQQQVMAYMAQAGFQLIQQPNGQLLFHNTMNGQAMPFEQAAQQFIAASTMQQRPQMQFQPVGNMGYQQPPQQVIQGRYTASSPPATPYPTGSVQAANQRTSDASQTGGFPTELGNRFGAPAAPQQPVQQQPVQKEVNVAQQVNTPEPSCTTGFTYRSNQLAKMGVLTSRLSTLAQRHVDEMTYCDDEDPNVLFTGSSVRGIFAGELNRLFKQTYKPLYRFDALVSTEHIVNTVDEYEKLHELFTLTETRAVYKSMRRMLDTKMSAEAKAALIGLDRNMTTHVNDFLIVALGGGTQIDSFIDDFNSLLKLLRDQTETCEDDLLEHLTEVLTDRSQDPQENKVTLTITDRVELVRIGVLSEEIGFDSNGKHSKAFDEKLTMIMKGVTRGVVYIQTLDNELYKLYDRSPASVKEFILVPFCE